VLRVGQIIVLRELASLRIRNGKEKKKTGEKMRIEQAVEIEC
jgi:hypothetical protein